METSPGGPERLNLDRSGLVGSKSTNIFFRDVDGWGGETR